MKKFLKMLKPYRGSLILSIVFSAFYAVLEMLIPVLTEKIMEKGINGENMDAIIKYGLIMIFVTVVGGIMSVLNTYFSTKCSVNYAMGLRNEVFKKVSHLSQCDVDKIGVSSLMTRTTNDVRQVHDVILNSLKQILPVPIMLIGGFVMAYKANAKLLKLIFIVIPFLLIIVVFGLVVIMPMFKKVQKLLDKLNFILRGKIGGIRVIRAFNKSEYEDNRFDESNEKLTKLSLKANRILSSLMPILTVALYSLLCYIIYVSIYDVTSQNLTPAQVDGIIPNIMMFIAYFTMIIGALMMVVGIFVSIPRASVSMKRINEILDSVPEIQEPDEPVTPDAEQQGVVEFKNVSFRYKPTQEEKKFNKLAMLIGKSIAKKKAKKAAKSGEEVKKENTETAQVQPEAKNAKGEETFDEAKKKKTDVDAVHNISFVAKPGEITAIIGVTGCGKSTLANLIPRLYDVTEGAVLVNGVDVKKLSFENLHSSIAFVPQQSYLFSGTIRDNIKFGNPEATDEEVWRAIEIAQAKSFVSNLDEGLDSFVSQAGKNFSGGQKQRLSIARAIVKNADIYIFDDSFSALDLATDARLRASLKENLPHANVIIVAQRVGTVINADRIVVMDNGEAVGIGTHAELLKNCEIYKSIVASQLSIEEEAV